MGPTRRGRRSAAASERRKSQWLANGGLERFEKALAENTTIATVAEYSVGAPINAANVTEKKEQGLVPRDLPSVTPQGRFLVPTPPDILSLRPFHPPYVVARFDQIVKDSVEKSLMAAWGDFAESDVCFREFDPSKTPVLHFSVWDLYASNPGHQKDDVRKLMNRFRRIVQNSVAFKISNILRSHYPEQFNRHSLACKHTMINTDEIANRPALEGEGTVNKGDIDLDEPGITWIIPLGDWEGAEFCIPQLNMKIPIRSGQILGTIMRVLAPRLPVKGRRIILTLFADNTLLEHSS